MFQIVIPIFILYARTFGINNLKKLDRWIREKIGKWARYRLADEKR